MLFTQIDFSLRKRNWLFYQCLFLQILKKCNCLKETIMRGFTICSLCFPLVLVTDMVGSISIELHNIISRHPRFVTAFTQHWIFIAKLARFLYFYLFLSQMHWIPICRSTGPFPDDHSGWNTSKISLIVSLSKITFRFWFWRKNGSFHEFMAENAKLFGFTENLISARVTEKLLRLSTQ